MIRILFYGRLSDAMGRERMIAASQAPQSLAAIVAGLASENNGFADALAAGSVRYAVNDEIVEASYLARRGDVVALLPPFSGG